MIEDKTTYELCLLTPFRAAVLNLIFVGIPFRFGLLSTGILVQDWLHEVLGRYFGHLDEMLGLASRETTHPCSFFAATRSLSSSPSLLVTKSVGFGNDDDNNNNSNNLNLCSNDLELRAVHDLGGSFLQQYALICFVMFVLWWKPQKRDGAWVGALLEFHRVFVVCTLLSLLLLAFFQKTHPPLLYKSLDRMRQLLPIQIPPSELWNAHFFTSFVFYNLVALSLSLWTLLTRTQHEERDSDRIQKKQEREEKRRRQQQQQQQQQASLSPHNSSNSSNDDSNDDSNNNNNIIIHPSHNEEFLKWSIPANALFCGAVVALFIATAQGQALYEGRASSYYHYHHHSNNNHPGRSRRQQQQDDINITPRIQVSLGVQAFYNIVHAIWLLRIRSFLSMPQLRSICAYQVICSTSQILFMIWRRLAQQQQHVTDASFAASQSQQEHPVGDYSPNWTMLEWTVYITLSVIYALGFLCAGQADGVSAMLTSEKEDDFASLRRRRQRRRPQRSTRINTKID